MRLLLDESVPAGLRRALRAHQVRTAVEMGWSGVTNGKLLTLAAADFDAFVTVDKNLAIARACDNSDVMRQGYLLELSGRWKITVNWPR